MTFALVNSASGGKNLPAVEMDTTGADLLVAVVCAVGSSSPTDDNSNTWAPLTEIAFGTRRVRIFYAENPTVGTGHGFGVTGGDFQTICVAAYSGAALSSVFNKESTATGVQPGSVTPDQDDSLLVTIAGYDQLTTQSIDGGFSIQEEQNYAGGNRIGSALADLIQTTAAAANPSWAANTDASAIAVFKPAGGGEEPAAFPFHLYYQGV